MVKDYDSYYLKLLKNALKYGMSRNDFWNCDIQEYYAYEISYIERIHEQTHIQGLYNFIAYSTIMKNMFKEKGEKDAQYPTKNIYEQETINNSNNQKKEKITKENLEKIYRKRLANCY